MLHKSKTDYLILDRKKWDFKIRIILIQIKCFEQLALHDMKRERSTVETEDVEKDGPDLVSGVILVQQHRK